MATCEWQCFPEKSGCSFGNSCVKSLKFQILYFWEQHYKTDPVYGLVQCRNYLTADQCLDCFTLAKDKIKRKCAGKDGAKIHLDGCSFRYENHSISSREAVDPGSAILCASANDSRPQEFKKSAQRLLDQLVIDAAERNGYASRSIAVGTGTIYALAQCLQFLDNTTCNDCLNYASTSLVQDCLPQHEGRSAPAGCFVRYANYSFSKDNIFLNLLAPSSQQQSKKLTILLGSVGGAAMIAAVFVVIVFKRFRVGDANRDENLGVIQTLEQVFFDYEALRYATGNFDCGNLIGRGGFGDVYKGTLVDGKIIAVKKLRRTHSTQATDEFVKEVELISSVRHRNLVRLLGCCMHGQEGLLVYEFMSNSSLDQHLFGNLGKHLDCGARFSIILGIARGLAYLHEESNVRIVHRDIKAGNILLDEKFQPRIADFGLAKFFPEGEMHVSTGFGGTIGYTAPEYVLHGQLSEKADVYSYGVLVLEIVSGRKCMNQKMPEPLQFLLEWVWRQYESNQVLDIVDPSLRVDYPRDQMVKVIRVALLCTQPSPTMRPAMSEVVAMLLSDSEIFVRPTAPAFIDANGRPSPPMSANPGESESYGTLSVSLVSR